MSIGVIEITPIAMTDAATVPVIAPRTGADKNHRIGKATANRPKQLAEGIEKVLCQATPLENRAHEGEERDRQQQVVRDDAEQLIGQVAEEIWTDQAEFDTDKSEEQSGCRQRECRRISDEHENNHACEHQGREVLADPAHCKGFSYLNSTSMTCSSAAMRLMISETPCNAIKKNPTGSSSFTGQRINPPAFDEASLMFQEFDKPRPGEIGEDHADRE